MKDTLSASSWLLRWITFECYTGEVGWRCLRGRLCCGQAGYRWRSWLYGRAWKGIVRQEGIEDRAREWCLEWKPCMLAEIHTWQRAKANFSFSTLSAAYFPSSVFHRPQIPVLLYVNRNVRFSLWRPGPLKYTIHFIVLSHFSALCFSKVFCYVRIGRAWWHC